MPATGTDIVEVTEATFGAAVLGSDRPFLLDFWATWCQPCKAIAPVLEQVATELRDRLRIGKMDIDTNMGLTQQMGIMSIPTLILFKGGRPVMQLAGATDARNRATLLAKLAPYLG